MYVITGAFGQTGSALTHSLLDRKRKVRMIVRRDDAQAAEWRAKGADIFVADLLDTARLTQALTGAQGAYLMNPPAYFMDDLFAQARSVNASLIDAANAAGLAHAVVLSSIGAQHAGGTGNILTAHDLERQLQRFAGRASVLRPCIFMENWAWSFEPAMRQGVLPSMFHPIEKSLPVVSATDVGSTAAALLLEPPQSRRRIVELHGPASSSARHAAEVLSDLMGRTIQAMPAAHAAWAAGMREQGFPERTVDAFVEMYDGFSRDHVCFEGTHETRRGVVTLAQALAHFLNKNKKP